MGDNVRFLTTNDTATPANSSGANGFPIPFVTGTPGAGTPWPLKVPFDEAIKLYWRVKNWQLSTDLVVTLDAEGAFGGPYTYSAVSGTCTIGGVNPPARELDLTGYEGYVQVNFGTGGTGNFLLLGYSGTQVPTWIQDNPSSNVSDLWPNFEITGTFGGINGSFTASVQFDTRSDILSTVSGSFTATIDGNDVTVYYDASQNGGGISVVTVDHMDFTPQEFWPYAALDAGGAIYDTSTGAQIQSPLD